MKEDKEPVYQCEVCGVIFRGTTDGSYLKCFRCGSTKIRKIEKIWEKKIILDKFGRERTVKISILCQYCPNPNCEGFYRRDAPRACLTFRLWKEGKLSLEQAIDAKYRQNKRHEETDSFRDEIYEVLEDYCSDYEDRVIAGSIASELVKGVPLSDLMPEDDCFTLGSFRLKPEDMDEIESILNEMYALQKKQKFK